MRKTPVIWILKRIRSRIPALLLMTVAQVCHGVCCVLFALGSKNVIDSAVAGEVIRFRDACLLQMGIIAGILISLTFFRHLHDKLNANLERDWKKYFLNRLLHGEYTSVSAYHSAELLNRLNNDVSKINEGILAIIPGSAAMVTRLCGAVVVLGLLDIRFAVLIVSSGLVMICVTGLARKKLKEINKRVSEHDGKVSAFLQEAMEKLLVIQAMNLSEEVESRSKRLLDERYANQKIRKNISLFSVVAVNIMAFGAGFLALCWCSYCVLLGQMSFGSLTAVIQLVNQLQSPFVGLSGIMPKYTSMIAAAERLIELDELPNAEECVRIASGEFYEHMQAIGAENLTFAYDRDVILKNASFQFEKNSFVVITGSSGKGKSTLLKLLLGVYRPDSGSMYMICDGEKKPLESSARGLFAYVPQGNLLFSGTIRDNLTIVRPDATEEEICQAVSVGGMDEYLANMPLGLNTMLGESGAGLSEGQAQRLAIARAVLSGAPILLLDECTSALDADTEERVLRGLSALPDRTCIAVTHRPAAAALSDCQLVVTGGMVQKLKKI